MAKGGRGAESMDHRAGSHSKLLCVASLAITRFLRMLPSSSLLLISFCVVQLRQTGVRKADGILPTQDEVVQGMLGRREC